MGGLGGGADINSELARALGGVASTSTSQSSTQRGTPSSAGSCKGSLIMFCFFFPFL